MLIEEFRRKEVDFISQGFALLRRAYSLVEGADERHHAKHIAFSCEQMSRYCPPYQKSRIDCLFPVLAEAGLTFHRDSVSFFRLWFSLGGRRPVFLWLSVCARRAVPNGCHTLTSNDQTYPLWLGHGNNPLWPNLQDYSLYRTGHKKCSWERRRLTLKTSTCSVRRSMGTQAVKTAS